MCHCNYITHYRTVGDLLKEHSPLINRGECFDSMEAEQARQDEYDKHEMGYYDTYFLQQEEEQMILEGEQMRDLDMTPLLDEVDLLESGLALPNMIAKLLERK